MRCQSVSRAGLVVLLLSVAAQLVWAQSGTKITVPGATIVVPPTWKLFEQNKTQDIYTYSVRPVGDYGALENDTCSIAPSLTFTTYPQRSEYPAAPSTSGSGTLIKCGGYVGRFCETQDGDWLSFSWGAQCGKQILLLSGGGQVYARIPPEQVEKQRQRVLADRDALQKRVLAEVRGMLTGSVATAPPAPPRELRGYWDLRIGTDQGNSWIENVHVYLADLLTQKQAGPFRVTAKEAGMPLLVGTASSVRALGITRLEFQPGAVYHVGSRAYPSLLLQPLTVPKAKLGATDFRFSQKDGVRHTFAYRLPLCPVTMNVSARAPGQAGYTPVKASLSVFVRATKKWAQVLGAPDSAPVYVAPGCAQLLVPTAAIFNSTAPLMRASGGVFVQGTRLTDARVFPALGQGGSAVVELKLTDPRTRLKEWIEEISRRLTTVAGTGAGSRFAGLKLQTAAQGKGASFLAGTVNVPGNFDHTADQSTDVMLHELGHATAWAMQTEAQKAPPDHTQWAAVPHPSMAWDEGRAHLLGQLYGGALGVEVGKEWQISAALACGANKPTASNPTPGQYVEGVVATLFTEYYRGMPAKAALDDFLTTEAAAHNAGLRLDTTQKFIAYKVAALQQSGAAAQAATLQMLARQLHVQ